MFGKSKKSSTSGGLRDDAAKPRKLTRKEKRAAAIKAEADAKERAAEQERLAEEEAARAAAAAEAEARLAERLKLEAEAEARRNKYGITRPVRDSDWPTADDVRQDETGQALPCVLALAQNSDFTSPPFPVATATTTTTHVHCSDMRTATCTTGTSWTESAWQGGS